LICSLFHTRLCGLAGLIAARQFGPDPCHGSVSNPRQHRLDVVGHRFELLNYLDPVALEYDPNLVGQPLPQNHPDREQNGIQ